MKNAPRTSPSVFAYCKTSKQWMVGRPRNKPEEWSRGMEPGNGAGERNCGMELGYGARGMELGDEAKG